MVPQVMESTVNPRVRILQACRELFMAKGVRAVTMDDVAGALGMSKKTIYQYFTQKEEIVRLVAEQHMAEEREAYSAIMAGADNALLGLYEVIVWDISRTRELNPLLPQEVRRYFPHTWQLFVDFSAGFMLDLVRENLQRGIREGLYRSDLDPEIMARILISSWEALTHPLYFPVTQFTIHRVQFQHLLHFLHGIVSPTGAELLARKLQSTPLEP